MGERPLEHRGDEGTLGDTSREATVLAVGRAAAIVILTAVGYYVSARLGYLLAIPRGVVTLWPPSGLMLGLLLVSHRRDWPALAFGALLGSLCSDLRSGHAIGFAIAAALANVIETLAAASLVLWRLRRPLVLSSLRDVGELVLGAAVVSNAVTACLGATVLHVGLRMPLASAWLIWWVGDGLGMLIIAPVIVGAVRAREFRTLRSRDWLEAVAIVVGLIVVGEIVLGPAQLWAIRPGRYAVFPLILWAALRFGPFGGALATLTIAAISTWNAALGLGPCAGAQSGADTAAQVYAFLAVASLCALVPGVILEERELAFYRWRKSESRYRAVVDAATDAIITIDERSRILFANLAVHRVFGYLPEELTGRELTVLMPPVLADQHRFGLARYLATGEHRIQWQGVELVGRRKDGTEVPIEISFGELLEDGNRVFTGIVRDVSERHAAAHALSAAEARMRFAMEASRVGVWEVDFTTGAVRWSEILEALHGLSPGTFGGTFPAFLDQIHPEDRQQVASEFDRATREHLDANILYRTTWADGTVHWLTGVGRTFYDAEGVPIRTAGIVLDVTERRALEEQYRQSQKMEAIGQLAGGVAHDFNNLLTAIQAYGSMLGEALEPNSREREDVDEILRAADRGASLTRQLLAFSRQQVLAPRPLNLGDVVRSIEPMLRRLIGERIDLVVRSDADVGHILADPGQIEQVIMNLAVNAGDAMPDGGILSLETVNMELDADYERTHVDSPPGRYVMLAVTDTGTGMDAATAKRVFEPFFTTKAAGKGTGLGLSTVYGIVKQSGATVKLYTEPGRGSTFKIYFPRIETVAAPAPVVTRAASQGGSETILVVEDDAALRKMAVRILDRAGYAVLAAGTPKKAIEIAATLQRIDLLLTDLVLPEMSGRELAERLSERLPEMRILYMSGYTDDSVVRHGVLERESQFIHKPFAHDALLRKVRETLDQQAGRGAGEQ
ncbi:MAG: PAS domain S-box protein [Gemmatimonadaceae bacterium]